MTTGPIRLALLAVLAVLAVASPAQAAITVANTNDSGPGSLRQAIAEAPPGAVISVQAGTYTLTSGPLNVVSPVAIAGAGRESTVIRSGGAFRVIEFNGEFPASLSDLTIRDGHIDAGVAQGAGIYSNTTDLTLRRVSVLGNLADADGEPGSNGGVAQGGGVYFDQGTTGGLTLLESTVSTNVATANGASGKSGGVAQGGAIFVVGPLIVANSTIADNLAAAMGGGGPPNAEQLGGVVQGAGLFAVHGSTISGTVVGTTVSGNISDASHGPGGAGGVVQGGAIFHVVNEAPTSYWNSTIAGNTARAKDSIAQGGGLWGGAGEKGSINLSSSTVSGNAADGSGFAGSSGGNLYLYSNGLLRNSIVAGGSGPAGSENCGEFKGLSLGFNIDSLDQCGFKAPGDKVNTDPQLSPLAFNGGPTQTMAPAAFSPAIDQGAAIGSTTDQRGVVRPIDLPTIPNAAVPGADGSDIGAFELQPSNQFGLGRLKRNKKKGTATLVVNLPAPTAGSLTLFGKGLKKQSKAIVGQTQVRLKVAIKNKRIRRKLRKKGRRKVGIKVSYAPTGNATETKSRKATLVQKKKKRKKKSKRHNRERRTGR